MRQMIFRRMAFAAARYLIFTSVLSVFATTTASAQAARNQVKQERLEFPRGVTEVARKGSLRGYATREYVLSASEGQTLSVNLDSKTGALVFSVFDKATMLALNIEPPPVQITEWSGRL